MVKQGIKQMKKFNPLPPDINRWINLLEKSTVPLPDYVSKIGE